MTKRGSCFAFKNFQEECHTFNVPNHLIQSIKNILNDRGWSQEMEVLMGALQFVVCKNDISDVFTSIEEFKWRNKNLDTYNILAKVWNGTYQSTRKCDSLEIDRQNIIVICLLCLNTIESPAFDKILLDVLNSITLIDSNNSILIARCLVELLSNEAIVYMVRDYLSIFPREGTLCSPNIEKVMAILWKIGSSCPELFFKNSNRKTFWEMVKDKDKAIRFEDAEKLGESVIGILFGLYEHWATPGKNQMASQLILKVICDIVNKSDAYRIDEVVRCQLYEKLVDILKVANSETSILDLLRSIEKIFPSLPCYRHDCITVSNELEKFAENNLKVVNKFMNGYSGKLSSVLSKLPNNRQSLNKKFDNVMDELRELKSGSSKNTIGIFSNIESKLKSLANDGYDISRATQLVIDCARKHSKAFNDFVYKHDSVQLIAIVMPIGNVHLSLQVKIKYADQAVAKLPKQNLVDFLFDCLHELYSEIEKEEEEEEEETETRKNEYLKEVWDTIGLLFESISQLEHENQQIHTKFAKHLEENKENITKIFYFYGIPDWFCKFVAPCFPLDLYVRVRHMDSLIEYSNENFLRETMFDCLWELEKDVEKMNRNVEKATKKLLKFFKSKGLSNLWEELEPDRHKWNNALRKHQMQWLCELLYCLPEILDDDVKIKYYGKTMQHMDKESLRNLFYKCIQLLAKPSESSIPPTIISSSMEKIFFHLEILDGYQEKDMLRNLKKSHRSDINVILRKTKDISCQKFLHKKGHEANLLDFDVKMKFFEEGVQLMNERSKIKLLSECLCEYITEKYDISKKTISDTVMELSADIGRNFEWFKVKDKSHKKTINAILCKNIQHPKARTMFSLCLRIHNFLELDTQCLYVKRRLYRPSVTQVASLLDKNVCKIVLNTSTKSEKRKLLSNVECLLGISSNSLAADTKKRLLKYAEKNKEFIDLFFKRKGCHSHLLDLFIRVKDLLSFGIILKYFGNITWTSDRSFAWDFTSVCLQEYKKQEDQILLTRLKNAIVSTLNILKDNESFEPFFEKHVDEINTFLHREDEPHLFISLLSHHEYITINIKLKYVMQNIGIDDDIALIMVNEFFDELNDELKGSPTKELTTVLLEAVEVLLRPLTASQVAQVREKIVVFANMNSVMLDRILFENKASFDEGSVLEVLCSASHGFNFDVKILYIEMMLKHLKLSDHWQLLGECLERYRQNNVCVLETINTIFRHFITVGMKPEEHEKYAEEHMDSLNFILETECRTSENNSIFEFLSFYPKFITFNNKIKHLEVFLKEMDFDGVDVFVSEFLNHFNYPFQISILEIVEALSLCIAKMRYDNEKEKKTLQTIEDHFFNSREFEDIVRPSRNEREESPPWKTMMQRIDSRRSTTFEQKIDDLREKTNDVEGALEGIFPIEVKRDFIFDNSYDALLGQPVDIWKKGFQIKFVEEAGVDAGGPMREWFAILAETVFDPNHALFTVSSGNETLLTINKTSYIEPKHLDYFEFVGRFIGKCVRDRQCIKYRFTESLYKHMLGLPLGFADFKMEDPTVASSLKFVLDNPMDESGLELTFSTEIEEYGMTLEKDLKKNGRNIDVTDENKTEFVQLMCEEKMTGSFHHQLSALLRGFDEIIPRGSLSQFTANDLELLLCGPPVIDVEDMKAGTEYEGYVETDQPVEWFWQAVQSFEEEDKANLLMFYTGSPKSPPEGFSVYESTKLRISRVDNSDKWPTAHTCNRQIDLPHYGSYVILREKLMKAVQYGSRGYEYS